MYTGKILYGYLVLFLMLLFAGCGGGESGTSTLTVQMGGAIQGKTLSLAGAVTTLAGAAGNNGSADGAGALASFNELGGFTTDGQNLFIADSLDNTIRKVAISTGEVTTLAGVAGAIGSADGIGAAARFSHPSGITTDGTNLFVTDSYNRTVRKIEIATGAVTTLAGTAGNSGSADGAGAAASFSLLHGITTDGTNLYVTDGGNATIRKIVISTGAVTTFAGTAGITGSADGTGSAASFYGPVGITTDGTNLYVTEPSNKTIRKIVISTGAVTTLAGTAGTSGSVDGIGSAARFDFPGSITTDGTNLYLADYPGTDKKIRKIVISTGAVTSLPLSTGLVDVTPLYVSASSGITTDGKSLYVSDLSMTKICKIQ
ncbi:MAG: hypothetical protein NDI77_02710 [Geobacteraceae bacterium]|nr:hypothetical protein [Geobacteraceae bacterium]